MGTVITCVFTLRKTVEVHEGSHLPPPDAPAQHRPLARLKKRGPGAVDLCNRRRLSIQRNRSSGIVLSVPSLNVRGAAPRTLRAITLSRIDWRPLNQRSAHFPVAAWRSPYAAGSALPLLPVLMTFQAPARSPQAPRRRPPGPCSGGNRYDAVLMERRAEAPGQGKVSPVRRSDGLQARGTQPAVASRTPSRALAACHARPAPSSVGVQLSRPIH